MIDNLARRIALALAAAAMMATPAMAQVKSVDPDKAIDADLRPAATAAAATVNAATTTTNTAPAPSVDVMPAATVTPGGVPVPATTGPTWHKDDLIGAAEGVFGKGARGLAGLIEDLLKKQGEPNAYITGREAGGALVVGVRYGSGTLFHKVEGEMPAYWRGPSVGFDAGANAAATFVLVYNLYDTGDLYKKRFPAAEGQAYLVGGFHVSYLRRGDVVLIPVRTGAGLRLGVNAGYMRFSKKQKWVPF